MFCTPRIWFAVGFDAPIGPRSVSVLLRRTHLVVLRPTATSDPPVRRYSALKFEGSRSWVRSEVERCSCFVAQHGRTSSAEGNKHHHWRQGSPKKKSTPPRTHGNAPMLSFRINIESASAIGLSPTSSSMTHGITTIHGKSNRSILMVQVSRRSSSLQIIVAISCGRPYLSQISSSDT